MTTEQAIRQADLLIELAHDDREEEPDHDHGYYRLPDGTCHYCSDVHEVAA